MENNDAQMQSQENDEDPEIYEERFETIVNNGFVALGIALGNKLGLFKTLTEFSKPESSITIAQEAGLQERYVREWLFSMVAAKIVFITADDKYYIPHKCKEKTKRSLFATLLPAISPLTDQLLQCFQSNVSLATGYNFSKMEAVVKFEDEDSQIYNVDWIEKNLLPKNLKKDDIKRILDIGCGPGRIAITMAKCFPDSHVTGIDIAKESIDIAIKNKEDERITNVDFVVCSGENLREDWTGYFDWVTMVKVLHDLSNPDPCVKEVHRVLKDNGVFTAVDPIVHSDPRLNIGNQQHAANLLLSCYICLPCSVSSYPAVGNAVGWGVENRAKYLSEKGFYVQDDKLASIIHCNKNTSAM